MVTHVSAQFVDGGFVHHSPILYMHTFQPLTIDLERRFLFVYSHATKHEFPPSPDWEQPHNFPKRNSHYMQAVYGDVLKGLKSYTGWPTVFVTGQGVSVGRHFLQHA